MKNLLATGAILLGFLVLISLFLGPRIYLDHSLFVGDSLYSADPTFEVVGRGFFKTRPSNFLIGVDNTLEGYPHRHYIQGSLARGEFPWWNPYVGMGMPSGALGAFEPLSAVIGFLSPPEKLHNFTAVAGLWIAASGMFVFLGTLGVSRWARVFGAIAFTFSGWTIVWMGRHNFLTEIWMPWIFWAAERLIRKPSVERAGVLTLFSALVVLPAHLPTSFHIFAALALYVLARARRARVSFRDGIRIFLPFALAVMLGVVVGAVQIIPLADLIAQADLPPQGRGKQLPAADLPTAVWYGLLGNWELSLREGPTILTAISPLFFGSPRGSTYWWPWKQLPEAIMYAGLLPLFFALYGLARRREIPGVGFWLGLALLSAGAVYALPLFNLVNYLPGFNLINNGRLRLVYRFAVVVTAALGFDRFTAVPDRQAALRRLAWIGGYAAVALGLPILAYLALTSLSGNVGNVANVLIRTVFSLVKAQTLALATALVAFAVVGAAFLFRLMSPLAFRFAVVAITFVELFWILHDFNPPIPSQYVFPETPVLQFLRQDPSLFRVSSTSLGDVMPPNTKLPYRIFDVDIYSLLPVHRYATLQTVVTGPVPPGYNLSYKAFRFSDPAAYRGLINLMNIKYFVIPPADHDGAGASDPFRSLPQYRPVYDQEVKIYQNLEVMPRVFLVDRAIVVGTPVEALRAVTRRDFDPAAAVVLEDPASFRLAPQHPAAADAGTVEILSLKPTRVVVRAQVRRPAYLVLSEVYYPGWRAWVDGKETPIYRADYLFRAVYLDPGSHDVVFMFRPRYYLMAGVASLAATVVVGSCLVWGAAIRLNSRLRQKESVPYT